jgi:hypothetical protein
VPTTNRVWDPTKVSITIGEKAVIVEPRTLRQLLVLEDAFKELTGMSWFTGEEQDATLDFAKIKDNLLAVGFEPLKIAIPELTDEDCLGLSIPQLTFVFNVILEVNGLNLMKDLVKNFAGPLMEAARRAIPRVMASISLDQTEAPGETTPTES